MRDRESGEISCAETSVLQQYFTEMLTIIPRYFTAPPFGNYFLREEEKCLIPWFSNSYSAPTCKQNFSKYFPFLSHPLSCLWVSATSSLCCSSTAFRLAPAALTWGRNRLLSFAKPARYSLVTKSPNYTWGRGTPAPAQLELVNE